MKTVTSSANGAVKRARKLLSKKGRDTDDAFLIEGFILIEEAVRSGADIGEVFVRGPVSRGGANEDSASERLGELGPELSARAVILDAPVFDTLTDTVTPKDMIAVVRKPRPPAEKGDALLVLDRIQDPGNVGTLLRTADAIGMDGVVCVKGTADPFSPKVCRAAAGAIFRVPVHECGEPADAVRELGDGGHRIVCLDMDGSVPCWDADLSGRVALVVGNEGGGVAREFPAAADSVVRVPMAGHAESLNAAVAAGMVMYERLRQIGL